jgi:hypothetical protein
MAGGGGGEMGKLEELVADLENQIHQDWCGQDAAAPPAGRKSASASAWT